MSRLEANKSRKEIVHIADDIQNSFSGEYGYLLWKMSLMLAEGMSEILNQLAEINQKLDKR